MAIEWSGLTPELMLRLDRESHGTLGSQLQNALRDAIRSGRLLSAERLPSSRTLAADLGISRGLVQAAYEQLGAEGYLLASAGAATRVASTSLPVDTDSADSAPSTTMEIDFVPGRPDLNSFPMRDWSWASREVARTASSRDLGYGPAQGFAHVREVVAAYLQRVRGASVGAGDVVICSGFTQGLSMTLAVLRARGATTIAIEDPGHLDMSAQVVRAGLRSVFVPVDSHGLVVAELAGTPASAVIVTPAHQTPTGVVLTLERRQELVQWAQERNGIIIEDDYDSEFRYDRRAVGVLQGLAPDRVVNIGSTSKVLAPALRLGWVLAPSHLVREIAEEKYLSDRGSPSLDQLILAALMESGRYDRHLRHMRTVYSARRSVLLETLSACAPHVRLTGLAAGFHAVAELPAGADEESIIARAAQRGIGLQGLHQYRSSGASGAPGIVFGYGDLSNDAIRRGVERIAELL